MFFERSHATGSDVDDPDGRAVQRAPQAAHRQGQPGRSARRAVPQRQDPATAQDGSASERVKQAADRLRQAKQQAQQARQRALQARQAAQIAHAAANLAYRETHAMISRAAGTRPAETREHR
ncbi:hypothetical protein Psi01_19130 [Planobispora siamensis]|uniref:Uncharacterized protein n=1 Tax=Planobispora siamensis TaxID=936338 RepID=A0A8J3SBX2_9ACTN|nr:hypothetical protein Psi01_19130 [Planobispora siamensis]